MLQAFARPPGSVAGWHCQASCALFAPTFSFKSLQGSAIIRNTKGKKCHRSTAPPRGPVNDKTNKCSRDAGEQEKERKRKQNRERTAESPRLACVLADPFPLGKEPVLRKLISPRGRKWGNYREDATGLGRTRFSDKSTSIIC